MTGRTAEMVRLICQRKGTYDSGEVYDALFDLTRGNPPLDQRGIARMIMSASWSRDTGRDHWRPEGIGTSVRSRKLRVFEYEAGGRERS